MHDYPEAYTDDNLDQILDANDSFPDYISATERERILDVARQRAAARGSALDDTETDALIATDWGGFASGEFGFDNDEMNTVALGVLNERASAGKGATLFTDTVVVQDTWLTSGDGRKTQTKAYVDDEYDNADEGDMWVPNGAQDYICIVCLSNELLHSEPTAAEAM